MTLATEKLKTEEQVKTPHIYAQRETNKFQPLVDPIESIREEFDSLGIGLNFDELTKTELKDIPESENWDSSRSSKFIALQEKVRSLLTENQSQQEKLSLEVLGMNSQMQILVWHEGRLLKFKTQDLRKDIYMLLGIEIPLGDDGRENPEIIKHEIIRLASEKGFIEEESPLKTGIWNTKNGILLISGKEAILSNKEELNELNTPVVEGKIILFEKKHWVKTSSIKLGLATCSLNQSFECLYSYIKQWKWKNNDMALYATAFVLLAPFQTMMRWRPWIYLTGPTGCGKSTFFEEILQKLFGNLCKTLGKTTAYAMCQSVGNSGKIPILDEFEKSKHIPEILEDCKLMNRGGEKTRGTPGEDERCFTLHHMPWFGSIYMPRVLSIDEAQRNRIVRFDLLKRNKESKLSKISSTEAENLGTDLVTSMFKRWDEIEKKTNEIESRTSEIINSHSGEVDPRTVENFMYPSAILSCVYGRDFGVPDWARFEQKDDGKTVIEVINSAKLRYAGDEHVVADLISTHIDGPQGNSLSPTSALEALRQNGISLVNKKEKGWFVAIRSDLVRRNLLNRDDDFKDLDISAPLERLRGAEKNVKTAWGMADRKEWALQIPIEHFHGA